MVTIQLSRDTIILIAALAFLVLAILLAVIFPGQTPDTLPGGTSVADRATQQPTSAHGTPQPTEPAELTPTSEIAGGPTADPFQPGGYPGPEEATPDSSSGGVTLPTVFSNANSEDQLTQTPEVAGGGQTIPTDIPPFQPNRPGQTPTEQGSFSGQTTYPAPGVTATADTSADDDFEDEPDVATAQPTDDLFEPVATPQPTPRPTTQPRPRPTTQPAGGASGSGGADAATPRPRPTPAPTAPPIDVLRGNVRWTAAQSPIFVRRDLQLAPGATLIVEPGVEVRVAPGAALIVEGTLYSVGTSGQPVRFVGSSGERWEAIYGRPGSNIALEHTQISGGGNGGTVLLSEGGNLVLRGARINENGGHVQVTDSRLEVQDSEIAGNDMPYGSALEANYTGGNFVMLHNNRIGGNRLQPGTSPVRISSQSPFDTLNLDIQGNLLVGTEGPDLALSTNGPLSGGLTCNTLMGGPDGLSVRSETTQVPGFTLNVRDNAIEKHTPPIIPIYLEYGIGRGATSEVALDMRNNWWGHSLGPYDPERSADGRGEAVGDNIEFAPWLTERPACAPNP
jgi:hypothetical protein